MAKVTSVFEIYREPTQKFLEHELEGIGHDPGILKPVIDRAISEAITQTEKTMKEGGAFRNGRFWQKEVEEASWDYTQAVLQQNSKIDNLKNHIKAYNSVFVVGAGISFESGLPLTNILDSLLKFCTVQDYAELQGNASNLLKFKNEFKRICTLKKPSISHYEISRHFPEQILEIICLNWDNMIELAAKNIPKDIPKINKNKDPINGQRYLWKFHGDVENVTPDNVKGSGGWIFPTDNGFVLDCFQEYLERNKIKDTMFTMVIVGYSESDETICQNVIQKLEREPPRPTFRIVLDLKKLHDEWSIVGPSDYILPKILN